MHVHRQFIYFLNIAANMAIIVGWYKLRGRQFFGRPTTFEVATPGILTERGLFFFFFVFWVADFDTLPFPFFDSVLALEVVFESSLASESVSISLMEEISR